MDTLVHPDSGKSIQNFVRLKGKYWIWIEKIDMLSVEKDHIRKILIFVCSSGDYCARQWSSSEHSEFFPIRENQMLFDPRFEEEILKSRT